MTAQLMPMASDLAACLEAARAAALVAHSAAGLASAAGLRGAARLLRASEGTARAGVAALNASALQANTTAKEGGPGDAGAGTQQGASHSSSAGAAAAAASPKPSRRRRRKKKHAQPDADMGARGEPPPVAQEAPSRSLKQQVSRERTPPPRGSSAFLAAASSPTAGVFSAGAAGTAGVGIFPVGQSVLLSGLVSRTDLENCRGKVVSYDASCQRYAIALESTGENISVKPCNVRSNIFG